VEVALVMPDGKLVEDYVLIDSGADATVITRRLASGFDLQPAAYGPR